jgi:hypothetical protein
MSDKEIHDLAGIGQIVDSEIAKESYKDAASPAMKELGALGKDAVKTFRLFTAPVQLLAAYQDRFSGFCDRVRNKVPEEFQQTAAANIAKPVMEAFAFTEDESPLMDMFEELMSKAIDKREASKLNPTFPDLIKNLSPLQAKLIKALKASDQITDDVIKTDFNMIVGRLYSNFSFDDFGNQSHHLTLAQDLKYKNIVVINPNCKIEPPDKYAIVNLESGHVIRRTRISLTMFGKWFADSCIRN